MQDAWRAYLEMALGLTEVPRKRAQKVAGELVNRGGATASQLQGLVEDLMSAGVANREALTNIVRYEVDRALGAVGLATAEEVSDLTNRVRELERQLRDAEARASAAESAQGIASSASGAGGGIGGERLNRPAPMPTAVSRPAKKALAKKAVKATPNAMPAAGTTPRPPAKKTGGKKAARAAGTAGTTGTTTGAAGAPADTAATDTSVIESTAAGTGAAGTTPAGTGESPTAPVTAAAADTVIPPARKAAKKAQPAKKAAKKTAKKAAPKKAPDTSTDTTLPEA
jgi:polyhydroxyalkanoate synthesis regulator phasin